MMKKNYKAVAEWALTGHTGMSSDALACQYLGLRPVYGFQHPHDCGDFGNCHRLLQAAPEIDIAIMRGCSPTWTKLAEAWPALTAMYEMEAPTERWPEFNRLITKILDSARTPPPATHR